MPRQLYFDTDTRDEQTILCASLLHKGYAIKALFNRHTVAEEFSKNNLLNSTRAMKFALEQLELYLLGNPIINEEIILYNQHTKLIGWTTGCPINENYEQDIQDVLEIATRIYNKYNLTISIQYTEGKLNQAKKNYLYDNPKPKKQKKSKYDKEMDKMYKNSTNYKPKTITDGYVYDGQGNIKADIKNGVEIERFEI